MYIDAQEAAAFLSSANGPRLVHPVDRWSNGVAYGCHPGAGDALAALNEGLAAFKATPEYTALFSRYPLVHCDCDAVCRVGEWLALGRCTLGCGKGTRSRSWAAMSPGVEAVQCPALQETRPCRIEDCDDAAKATPGAYLYLFDGCPRGGLAAVTKGERVMINSFLDRLSCERACTADPACNLIQVRRLSFSTDALPDPQTSAPTRAVVGPDLRNAL